MKYKICTKCKIKKPLSEFHKRKTGKYGVSSTCKECSNEYFRNWRKNNPERTKKYWNNYKENNREKELLRQREYNKKNAQKRRNYSNKHHLEYKLMVYDLLCDGNVRCRHCGITDERVLVIDHVNNNGKEERRSKISLITLYKKILDMGEQAKEEYQILCHNCNWLKEFKRRYEVGSSSDNNI